MKQAITGTTKLVGLLGYPISHSRSPRMHNLSFWKLGLDYVYLTFDVWEDNLTDAIKAMRTLGVKGFNVTMPNKKNVLPLLDELSQEASLIGSVNTVLNDNGKLKGYNTDGMGFVKNIEDHNIEYKGKKIVIAGSGGAGRAVAIQLAIEGVKDLSIFDIDAGTVNDVCGIINKNIHTCKAVPFVFDDERLKMELVNADIFVNCSPLGMKPHEGKSVIASAEMLPEGIIVCDIVYDPLETKTLQIAESRGCKTVGGLGMMYCQGALAFKIWTGADMPLEFVKEEMFK